MNYTESEILEQLDLAFNGIPSQYYPIVRKQDIKYNIFLDLEHGYCETAGSKIHLYADSSRWVIVFEKSGYQNRGTSAEIELDYVGNCIDYPVTHYSERNYITNSSNIIIVTPEEYDRIQNKEGESDIENFELIDSNTKEINIRGKMYAFESDYKKYEEIGIKLREYNNPKKLVDFGNIIRYLNETNPLLISATESEIRQYIPDDIPKLMTINEFHYESIYQKNNLPSQQETYKLIAKVLLTKDTTNWKPTLKANNHWSNWESGEL